jgi:hypothetical protein
MRAGTDKQPSERAIASSFLQLKRLFVMIALNVEEILPR